MALQKKTPKSEAHSKLLGAAELLKKGKLVRPGTPFVEDKVVGLGITLLPLQRVIMKALLGEELDDKDPCVNIRYFPAYGTREYNLTEKQALEFLYQEGRTNIREPLTSHREVVMVLGRRSGKTFMVSALTVDRIYRTIMYYLENGHSILDAYSVMRGRVAGFVLVSTAADQSQDLAEEIRSNINNSNLLREFITRDVTTNIDVQDPRDIVAGSGKHSYRIKFSQCSARAVRGKGNLVVIMDELAHFFDTDGNASDKKVYEALIPSVSQFGHDGLIFNVSTPLEEGGKFFELYKSAKDGDDSLVFFQIPTWWVRPDIDIKFFETRKRRDPDAFDREYGAEFGRSGSPWINNQTWKASVDSSLEFNAYGIPSRTYYAGIDLGLKNDRTTMAIVHKDGDNVILDNCWTWSAVESGVESLSLDTMLNEILQICRKFSIRMGIYDQWYGLSVREKFQAAGVSNLHMINMTETLNAQIYSVWKGLLMLGKFRANYPQDLWEELTLLRMDLRRKGIEIVSAPAGKHDDRADAIARATYLCVNEGKINISTGLSDKKASTVAPIVMGFGGMSRRPSLL